MHDKSKKPKVIIVGGGLVGALNAIFFGQTGKFDVLLCEKRSDIRLESCPIGRSINLALSHRGRCALKAVGLEDEIIKSCIPMYARMIHNKNGQLKKIRYSRLNNYLCAVDRKVLNELLLSEAEKIENVEIKYNWKLVNINFENQIATFSYQSTTIDIRYDLLVGNDGAYSTVRQFMAKAMCLDYSQEYIPHGYKEIHFPKKDNNEFQMDNRCLHIWPRNEFMLIGLPNPDGSFTGTLFMPIEIFQKIKNSDDLIDFFEDNFPDALKIIGKSELLKHYSSNEPSRVLTIRCAPYHYQHSCVIMGDAAHAMVPFYGQGMNCGFEDLLIFHQILKDNDFKFENTCKEFTDQRNEDAKAICDLALYNYIEMRKLVTSRLFLFRKQIDEFLNYLLPSYWKPLYEMVSFTRIPYSKCISTKKKQDQIVSVMGKLGMAFIICGLAFFGHRLCRNKFQNNYIHICVNRK